MTAVFRSVARFSAALLALACGDDGEPQRSSPGDASAGFGGSAAADSGSKDESKTEAQPKAEPKAAGSKSESSSSGSESGSSSSD